MATEYRLVTPGYLESIGIELRRGRTITRHDRRDAERVVVINGVDETALLEPARRTSLRIASGAVVQGTTTMSRVLDMAIGPARQVVVLLSLLTSLALTLGAVGIYGVIAHFAALLTRLLSSFLHGVTPLDPIAFAAAAAALLGVGLIAAFVPAWRAGTADPLTSLREP